MPELPEVQTVLSTLEHLIAGKKITQIDVLWDNILENVEKMEFTTSLIGKSFQQFKRKGKYLIFHLEDETLVSHLRMEGKFYYYKNNVIPNKHTHIVFHFDDGSSLHYHDVRKFGRMYLYHKEEELKALSVLGLEPWDKSLNVNYLNQKIRNRKLSVKQLLLDQSIIAGIGNIYASEILFRIQTHPLTLANKLTDSKLQELIDFTRLILEEAIAQGGTTVRSYTSSLGVSGKFQLSLYVYQREGEACKICGAVIKRITQNGRSSFYCPTCQKEQ